ncbi:MAG: ABC transporter permease [Verrucomicrobia bacterium]|nr:MAG: ABC transporter permease [Verrucomicrobiota bacterium]
MKKFSQNVGQFARFAGTVILDVFRPPIEWEQLWLQIGQIGSRSLPLVTAAGLATGVVMTLHSSTTLARFGASAMVPTVQSLGFFIEIGPLLTALLVAGRVGAGIGAILSNMRATEQIDAIEALSIDSFKFLVVARVLACVLVFPVLTLFTDFSGLVGGYFAEYATSHISVSLYLGRAFQDLSFENFVPPTIKTCVFGFIIGTVSSFFGYTTNEGAEGVGRAATNSVVFSSLLVIVADIVLVRCIFLVFPETAL